MHGASGPYRNLSGAVKSLVSRDPVVPPVMHNALPLSLALCPASTIIPLACLLCNRAPGNLNRIDAKPGRSATGS
jgi:hypothetical protein